MGHGYADYYLMDALMDAFIESVASQNRALVGTSARDTLDSHPLVFRIEQSRKRTGSSNYSLMLCYAMLCYVIYIHIYHEPTDELTKYIIITLNSLNK